MQVHVNGVDVEYVDQGAGVPVVFSHGGSSDLRYWEPQRAVFAARYRFVAYSHRFHGRGQWSAGSENSADAHADDLVAIMRRLGAGPVHLVGLSTVIALRATLRDPESVRTLTVVEPNVPWCWKAVPKARRCSRGGLRRTGGLTPRLRATPNDARGCGSISSTTAGGRVRRPAAAPASDVARQLQPLATRSTAAGAPDV
jgi:pimeloyl-ACP methyl ester carboxylesterase